VNTQRDYTRVGTTLLAAATLSVLLLFVAVPRSRAQNRAQCQQKMEYAEARLDQAIRQHGPGSKEANNWRAGLNATREECWNKQHGWWSANDHQWHNNRDWDRYDQERGRGYDKRHDHDRDHDHGQDHH
jgi:hypothetical protein